MASTSVYLPTALVERLDRLAAERGTSRNRIILMACEELLAGERGEWPAGFFEPTVTEDDLAILQDAGQEMEAAIYSARRDRPVPAL